MVKKSLYFGDYGVKCQQNDIIEMFVDFANNILSFKVNGKDLGICYSNIKEGNYNLAVTLYDGKCEIQMLEHRQLE